MRKRVKMGGILFCVALLASTFATAQEIRKPKVFLREHTYDFKEVMEGEVISHTFSIFNKGDDELKILRVKAG
ncbi:MAG: DUF1573 domain-containing protein [Desulfobacteraceae bacterium]|nr:MAG: DUF1573 domain-containing protein [Desulfobacteraceae bacterium]